VIVAWLTMALGLMAFVLVLHALRPLRSPSPLQVGALFASWVIIELPLHILAFVAVQVAVCLHFGGLGAWPGWIGLAGFLGAALGLLYLTRRLFAVARVVDEALDKLPPTAPPAHPYHWARLWVPTSQYQPAVVTELHIPYTDSGRRRHRLDIYRPKALSAAAPVVLQLHGGGWMIGHKRQQGRPLLTHLAANGFVCVAANYRLSPKATFPDHIIDVKRAVAWVRAHIGAYGGDPRFIAITGGSAGAHLAALAALTPNYAPWQPGFEDADTRVQACVPIYGVYDFTNRGGFFPKNSLEHVLRRLIIKRGLHSARPVYEAASPLYRLNAEAPPFFAAHGAQDTLAPVEQCREFIDALRAISPAPAYRLELPCAQHAFDVFPSVRVKAVLEGVRRFLKATASAGLGEERAGGELGTSDAGIGVHHEADRDRL